MTIKKIDRYIALKFVSTFFFSLTLIVSIACVIDFSEKVDDFIENKVTWQMAIARYYVHFIPYFFNLFSPLFIFISVIFFTSKMAANSEIIAILASGVSYRRLMRPYLLTSAFLGLLIFGLSSFVIPHTEKKRVDFENRYIKGRKADRQQRNEIHRQLEPGLFIYMKSFSLMDSVAYRFTMERFEGFELREKLFAEKLYWNRDSASWAVENFIHRHYPPNEQLDKGYRKDIAISFDPEDFFRREEDVVAMTHGELNHYIEMEQLRGSGNAKYYQTEKQRRNALPATVMLLTFIGVSVSSRKMRGGIGLHLGFGILIAFTFILFNQFMLTFATEGVMHPLPAVWIPIVVFSILGFALFRLAPK